MENENTKTPNGDSRKYLLTPEEAKELLENTDLSITEIAQNLGIEDSLYFCKKFKAFFGIAPSRYRKTLYL